MPTMLITGGSSGLGAALIDIYSRKDFKIINIDRNQPILKDVRNTDRTELIKSDLSIVSETDKILQILDSRNIDTLILNAAVGTKLPLNQMNTDQITKLINVNIYFNTRIMAKFLANNYVTNKKKQLILISSTAANMPTPAMAIYGATKSYLSSLAKSLQIETIGMKMDVFCFEISGMRTNFQIENEVKNADSRLLLSPEYVSKRILKVTNRRKGGLYTIGISGHILNIVLKFMPRNFISHTIGKLFAKIR